MKDIKSRVLKIAVEQWPVLSVRSIAREADVSHSSILYHFGNQDGLRDAIISYALATGNSRIIVQLIAQNDPSVSDLSEAVKNQHFAGLKVS